MLRTGLPAGIPILARDRCGLHGRWCCDDFAFDAWQHHAVQSPVVLEDGILEGMTLQKRIQFHTKEDRSLGVRHDHARQIQDMLSTDRTPRSHEQHQIPFGVECIEPGLMSIVATKFAFDRFGIQLRTNPFSAVIEFDDEVECPTNTIHQLKRSIGIERERFRDQFQTPFTCEVAHSDPLAISLDDQMRQKLCQ